MVLDDAEARHLRHLSLFRKLMFSVVLIVTALSLMSIPLRAAMVRDIWFGYEQDANEATINVWVYSIVAAWEVIHLLLMIYAFIAVYRMSAWKSLVTSLISVLMAITLLVLLIAFGSYGIIAASTAIYVILGFLFAFFGQYVMYEDIPIDFIIRTRDGKTSPLLA